ncbi:transcriptional regulator [Viridibacillus sp. YIM B01967]|uniref:Transcriptional regulator n=1 Tax=Viridibacillus soli TaxID=2798301 RepID=A0ABS1H3K8_9BACL|nr:helix-turn-helix domain-containing protein [Viridibacillus soli]MBK3494005.1 transcriptional regulator [Viridibacillus soli]
MLHPLKITSTLADETRFSIYQYMLQEKESFSVQNIADHFSIHPNVARLHLTKLTEIEVITSEYEKTGKGGRPGRIYKAISNGLSLSFPQRNYEEMLQWVLEIIVELGDDAAVVGQTICYKKGVEQIQTILSTRKKDKNQISFDERIEIITEAAALIGYVPVIHDKPEGKTIDFAVYNCPYHSQIEKHASVVCDLHESFLKGQFEYLFNVKDFVQVDSMVKSCKNCTYHIDI